MPMHTPTGLRPWATFGNQLSLLILTLMISLLACSIVGSFTGISPQGIFTSAAIQDVMAFCGSAFVMAWFSTARPFGYLGLAKGASPAGWAGMVIILLLGMPAMNQLIWWNNEMHLPESWGWLEESFRTMEDNASALTDKMLSGTSAGSLVTGILIVGCLTGFSEELFFRGALQKILYRKLGGHGAIWVAAFIFSALHFQFFGFVPRLILGAFFGYLYLWTGSIWVPATAHAVNNSLVVVTTWLANNGYVSQDIDGWGIAKEGIPWWGVASVIFLIIFFVFLKKYFYPTLKSKTSHG